MPRTKPATEEEYWKFYAQVEELLTVKGYDPVYARDIEELKSWLEKITVRQGTRLDKPTAKQAMKLTEHWRKRYEQLAPRGVSVRLIRYPWGTPVRFTIPGRRGWFKWASVERWMEVGAP